MKLRPSAVAPPLLILTGLAGFAHPAAAADPDPLLWPESQRAFLQDGPGLLLTDEQRAELLALDEAGREAFIQAFLDRDPIPETPRNELREGVERRLRLAALELETPLDARVQLLFLRGAPTRREVIDCGEVFRPVEVWTYGVPPASRSLVLYQATVTEPFRLWLPMDSKGALYTDHARVWLRDWEELNLGKNSIDRRFCPEAEVVDAATGVRGLGTTQVSFKDGMSSGRMIRWVRPKDRAAMLERPADLATWAREAAATPILREPRHLKLESLDVDFPSRSGQRLVARGLVSVKSDTAGEGGLAVEDANGKPFVRLSVDGVLERGDEIFERFRVRYRVPLPPGNEPIPLLFEQALRPGQDFLLRLRVRDEGSGDATVLTRHLRVPGAPVSRLGERARSAIVAGGAGESFAPGIYGRDGLLLLPPLGEVVLGTWRAEALVSGERIQKVVFLVDGQSQLSRAKAPFSAEVRLAEFPREQVVRAEGYDANGELVAADQVSLNQARGTFRVAVTEPRRGARPTGRVTTRAEIVVPEERRVEWVEFRLNDAIVSRLTQPPWQVQVDVPPGEGNVWVSVAARLDDGTSAEDVRFLRAPGGVEEMDVNLVELYVSVTDGSGRFIQGLQPGDFKVLEAGEPQTLSRFEAVESFPLTLGFVIDTSVSMASSLAEAQNAAAGLLRNVMTARDRAFAVGFSAYPYLVIPPTDDVEGTVEALGGLRATGRTALNDALITGLYYFRGTQGQRAMILLTDGDDTASSTSWDQALEYTRRSGVAVYPIGLGISTMGVVTRNRLETLADVTGGRVFYIQKAEELDAIYDQIEEELRSRYYLAYGSSRKVDAQGFRPVEVQVRKGKARTARGYYP